LVSSRADRDRNIARVARVACLLARNGVAVLVAAVSPYAAARAQARALATSQAIPFFEVFCQRAPGCRRPARPQGNVPASARRPDCELHCLSDPYEEPEYPDLVIHSDAESVATSGDRVVTSLLARGLV